VSKLYENWVKLTQEMDKEIKLENNFPFSDSSYLGNIETL
jgi:hypothetical protein